MKAGKQDLIDLELMRSKEAFTMAEMAIEAEFWNSAAGELYYACFYLIQALFRANDVQAHTHTGLKSLFSSRFIKEKALDEKWGKLLAKLFQYRQRGSYGDYGVGKETILPLINDVNEFKKIVSGIIEQKGYKTNNES